MAANSARRFVSTLRCLSKKCRRHLKLKHPPEGRKYLKIHLMVWPLNVYYSLTPNGGGGSTTQTPPNLARAWPSLKKVFESTPILPATVCKVASLHLKSKSFLRSMCKTDFHLFFRVFADDGLYRKNSEITFCVVISLHFVRLSPNLV